MIKKYLDQLVHNNDEFNEYLNSTLDQEKINNTSIVSILSAVVIFLFGIEDILSVSSNLHLILIIRVFISLNFVFIFYLTKQHQTFFLNYYHWIVSLAAFATCLGILAMILLSELGGIVYSTYFAGLMLVIIAWFSWFYVNTTVSVTLSLLVILGYIAVYFLKTESAHITDIRLLNNILFLFASISFGLIADVFRKYYLFKNFIIQKRLIVFLLPKIHKKTYQLNSDVFLSKLEFQQSINNCIFDAKTANLKLFISAINVDSIKSRQSELKDLTVDVLNVFYQQSNHEIKTYKEGNTIWSLSFSKEPLETFKRTLDTNIKRQLKEYKNKIEVKTAVLSLENENDFEDQKNQTLRELLNLELKTVSPNITLVRE